jgi:hypothetical protein
MKVALINPGKSGTSTAMPLGLSYLAAVIVMELFIFAQDREGIKENILLVMMKPEKKYLVGGRS